MGGEEIFLGDKAFTRQAKKITGSFVDIRGERFYRIDNYDQMAPFFMSVVSHGDHWMFISSTGGLTTGRKNADGAIFPYYTDDKIAQSSDQTGSLTILKVRRGDKWMLWMPFSTRYEGIYTIERSLLKNSAGNKIGFIEENLDLGLRFEYTWSFSDEHGLVRQSRLRNLNDDILEVKLLDGLQNILPYGVNSALQNERSNLVNAYKKAELVESEGLGLFFLNAIIVDRAEPSEALRATTAWSRGLTPESILLSKTQISKFLKGEELHSETDIRGQEACFIQEAYLKIPGEGEVSWITVVETAQDHAAIQDLLDGLEADSEDLVSNVLVDIENGTRELREAVAQADGLQLTKDESGNVRHYANVLFNIMRGGSFDDQYEVIVNDLTDFVDYMNKPLFERQKAFFESLGAVTDVARLHDKVIKEKDPDLVRLCMEYLPLSFSRRHGDPSRPWNKFSIDLKNADGSKNRYYQGNWRDIFQNWEALSVSFPLFIESMVFKFLNASTIDGYNPYRVTRNGIDWETEDPDDPWSFIGYWGDHQIVYLHKLLEVSFDHDPQRLISALDKDWFVFANVPYRLKSYDDMVVNSKDTIVFDYAEEEHIDDLKGKIGRDAKLLMDNSVVVRANLTEKLFTTLLVKVGNFIPGAGIWLNTQRPEWNDANNALVGNGASMVTLYQLFPFAQFLLTLLDGINSDTVMLNKALNDYLGRIWDVYREHSDLLKAKEIQDTERRGIADALGNASTDYRLSVYGRKDLSKQKRSVADLQEFLKLFREYASHTISLNQRNDGLYHTYNLISFEPGVLKVDHLYEMLEGQAAILGSDYLTPQASLELLNALRSSKIYRPDQQSFMLYPDREIPEFLDKNVISDELLQKSNLAQKLLDDGNEVILYRDSQGKLHFNADFRNAGDLKLALSQLDEKYSALLAEDKQVLLDEYEGVFDHKSFTGRSGTFFGYEGLGSIYWHMVSKLLLAVGHTIGRAYELKAPQEVLTGLSQHYNEIKEGIGAHKSPEVYGAVPTDPYSHTPAHKGAQQPGMTGQVKEDILSRWQELGIKVRNGIVYFDPHMLDDAEFLDQPATFAYYDVHGEWRSLKLEPGQIAFTYCQVPVIYSRNSDRACLIGLHNDQFVQSAEVALPEKYSKSLFERSGEIRIIEIGLGK